MRLTDAFCEIPQKVDLALKRSALQSMCPFNQKPPAVLFTDSIAGWAAWMGKTACGF